jgi:hypothetical protein
MEGKRIIFAKLQGETEFHIFLLNCEEMEFPCQWIY